MRRDIIKLICIYTYIARSGGLSFYLGLFIFVFLRDLDHKCFIFLAIVWF